MVRAIPDKVEESRSIPFVLSTTTRDAHHTVLNQDGWDLNRYRANPIVGYMHNVYGDMCNAPNPDDVIGLSKEIGVEEIEGQKVLSALAIFEPASINLMADKIFRKLIFGTLNAASVGFHEVGSGKWGKDDEDEGRENETYYFEGQELLEWSVVNIPSNPDGKKRSMREQTASALAYAYRALGGRFRLSQIEDMRVRDILDLMDGKDIELKETDPDKVRKILQEQAARDAMNQIIAEQGKKFKR